MVSAGWNTFLSRNKHAPRLFLVLFCLFNRARLFPSHLAQKGEAHDRIAPPLPTLTTQRMLEASFSSLPQPPSFISCPHPPVSAQICCAQLRYFHTHSPPRTGWLCADLWAAPISARFAITDGVANALPADPTGILPPPSDTCDYSIQTQYLYDYVNTQLTHNKVYAHHLPHKVQDLVSRCKEEIFFHSNMNRISNSTCPADSPP